jgi:hypothetical protein
LPESQSAVAVWVAKATVARVARENLMMEMRCWEDVAMLVWWVMSMGLHRVMGWRKRYLKGRCFFRREETYVGRAKQMAGESSSFFLLLARLTSPPVRIPSS